MGNTHFWRVGLCGFLIFFALSAPASALIIGTKADLEALLPHPENSEPVSASNSAPIARNLSLETYQNVAIMAHLSAYDREGDGLHYRIIKNPARGAVTLGEDGSFTYSPYEDKKGRDGFRYVVQDAMGNVSSPATVSIAIKKQKSQVHYADMEAHPAHKAAVDLAELEVMVGDRLGEIYFFRPEETLRRAEFLAMAMNTLKSSSLEGVSATGFSDDGSISSWAKPYVSAALLSGIVDGCRDERGAAVFAPESYMTYEEASVVVARLLNLRDVTADFDAASWSGQSLANLEAVGVLQTDTAPLSELLTRGDAAQLLSAALEVLEFRRG